MTLNRLILAVCFFLLTVLLLSEAVQTHDIFDEDIGSKKIIPPLKNGKYRIASDTLKLDFVPYGASISSFFIRDKRGVERDIVFGWDNATFYSIDKLHGHWGSVPGRYCNRIKNASFTIGQETYHTDPNDHGGLDTLHGGSDGWDYRNWTVVEHTDSTITFSLTDPAGKEGFPGKVKSLVTYSVDGSEWKIAMTAASTTQLTPIMLSSHTYWNLDGWQNRHTATALNHTLWLPYSGLRIGVDDLLIPTGNILANRPYSVNDFWQKKKQLGANLTSAQGNCGFSNCTGYDNAYLVSREALAPYDWRETLPVASLASAWSGITMDIYSDQDAIQVYSCNGQNGTTPLKASQGFHGPNARPRVLEKYGCLVLEVQDWIDGINHPEWGRDAKQLFGPGDAPYQLNAIYKFSVD